MNNEENNIPDDLNPQYIFSGKETRLLIKIATDKIDIVELLKKELKGRGYNEKGKYVGFNSNITAPKS